MGKVEEAIEAIEDLMTDMRIEEENDDRRSDKYTDYMNELDTIIDVLKQDRK